MNNVRDCPHGRQVGKCDTCDLIKTELDLQQVTAERDSLLAKINAINASIDKWESSTSMWDMATAFNAISASRKLTADQCLAAHDAEVAAKAVLEFSAKLLVNQKVDVIDCAKVEADQLRAKAGA